MLPEIKYNQKIYIEITNPKHGGAGWDLGTTLWSPVFDKGGHKAWGIMDKVNPGDLIIHLVKLNYKYHWTGLSYCSSKTSVVTDEPPTPDLWASMSPYQRISLEKYSVLENPVPISDFFKKYKNELHSINQSHSEGLFYVLYGADNELRMSQRYLANCPNELYDLFNDFSNYYNFNPELLNSFNHIPTVNEPSYADYSTPSRTNTFISRIIRDTQIVRELKEKYKWSCQICGSKFLLPNGKFYAEGHHLQPLGGIHKGPDIKSNIIILCPNHHTEFDYGSIAIDPNSLKIIHIDENNKYHKSSLNYMREDLNQVHLEYHYNKLFNKAV